jgi:hypothetical protein
MNIRHAHALALIVCSLQIQAAPPATPAPREEPPIISAYERKVLAKEMKTLSEEIRAARKAAAEDPSLAPLKEALDAAKQTKEADKIKAARRALSDAVETLLYKQDGMPEKIKRLLDVGNLLRYDTPNQREKRRQNRTVVHANPFPAASTNAPAEPAAPPSM